MGFLMKKLNFKVALALAIFSMSAIAETHVFLCEGTQSGPTFAEKDYQFEFKVNTKEPSVDGPQGIISHCELLSNLLPEPKTHEELKKRNELHQYKCRQTESEVSCKCSNGYFYKSSNLTFSRYSGLLSIISSVRDDEDAVGRLLHGQFLCRKANKKLF
jgi:hypothetical protein